MGLVTTLDRSDRASIKAMCSPVSSSAGMWTWCAVGRFGSFLSQVSGNMTSCSIWPMEMNLVSFTSKVVRQIAPHVFESINFCVLIPFVCFTGISILRVDPEWWPAAWRISSELVVILNLDKTISTNWEVAGVLGIFIDASLTIDSFTSIVGCYRVGSGSDIWCLSELCVFPMSITSSTVVIAVAESIVESSLHVKLIPTWTL